MLMASNAINNCQAGHLDANMADSNRASEFFNTIAPKRAAPSPLLERLDVTDDTLGDRVGEILLFCRSAARHTVRPAGRFPLAGGGGSA
jgi:hypothetical protein